MAPELDIVSTRGFQDGCYMPVAWAAEDALSEISGARIVTPNMPKREYLCKQNRVARAVSKFSPWLEGMMHVGIRQNVFMFLMGVDKELSPLLQDRSRRKWIYLFDTWEPDWDRIEHVLKKANNLQVVYMASSQAAEHFSARLSCPVKWLPQAAISSEFTPGAREWSDKRNIILNFGRSNKVLDEFFKKFSTDHGYEYICDRWSGEARFASRQELLNTLYQSKIVVVHPQNLDNPDKTGCVSMLTARNFEAYQSAGIVCGFSPDSGEFEKLKGDLPLITYADPASFEKNLLHALAQPEEWVSAELKCQEIHTWEKRLSSILVDFEVDISS